MKLETVTFQSAVRKWRFQETKGRWKSRGPCWAKPLEQHTPVYHRTSRSCVQSQCVWRNQSRPAQFNCTAAHKLNVLVTNCESELRVKGKIYEKHYVHYCSLWPCMQIDNKLGSFHFSHVLHTEQLGILIASDMAVEIALLSPNHPCLIS